VTERKKHDARNCENCTLFLRRPGMRAVLLLQAEESGCERVNSGVLLFAVKPASKPASITVTHTSTPKYDDYIPEILLLTYYSSLAEQERSGTRPMRKRSFSNDQILGMARVCFLRSY